MGLEPMTSPLPRECSTTELHQPYRKLPLLLYRERAASTANVSGPSRSSPQRTPATPNSAAETSLAPSSATPAQPAPPTQPALQPSVHCPREPYPFRTLAKPTTWNLQPYNQKNGAQGRIRTSVAHNAADLQSAAINHSATCALCRRPPIPQPIPIQTLARTQPRAPTSQPRLCMANAAREGTTSRYNQTLLLPQKIWSWRRDLNPRPPDYKSGALPAELRQPSTKLLTAKVRSQASRAQSQLYHSRHPRKSRPAPAW